MSRNLHFDYPADWVTVICICYNHQAYVREALLSVVQQTYPYIELIVVDNGSSDGSVDQINAFVQHYPATQFIRNTQNMGLNRAFNVGLSLAKGHYILDLSADDVLLPNRIAKQVALFEQVPDSYGVVFSNAAFIDETGKRIGTHYPVDPNGRARVAVPTGNVFRYVLSRYFICTPTMLIRRDVLEKLGGYDEQLSYEDFDFWVRSSRWCQYAYLDEVSTLKRQLPDSLSRQIVQRHNPLLPSTLVVCQKAFDLCQTPDEFEALAYRLRTFIRKAFYTEQFDLARHFGALLYRIKKPDWTTQCILKLSHLCIPVNTLYRRYHRQKTKPN